MEERQMARARKRARQRRRAKSLIGSMREFLTPEVFKQVRNASKRRKSPRWDLHPLLWILLLTTYCSGDSIPEKFEAARGFYAVCCPKRKRPGKSFAGFQKAITKLPMPILRALASGIRGRFQVIFRERWTVGSFIPFGCDGTRQNCPRTAELEQRLGSGGKEGSSPTVWNTSIVHLTLGIPFCWRLGKGSKPSERSHLIFMLRWLPQAALIVADAGYVGYEVVATMMTKVAFLIRMSSNATFYSETNEPLDQFREGIVYYWPQRQQKEGKPPLRGRLMRIHSVRHKTDVWLFTNVEDTQQLSWEMAATCYRWRWENEGFFRTYKRTLNKAALMSRTVAQVHREAEASMIATQLLLCQGAVAMPVAPKSGLPVMCSPRRILLEARHDISVRKKHAEPFATRITGAERERRVRSSAKEKREWPRRKAHTAPHPPILLTLTDEQKIILHKQLQAA
jgi:DDE family transposase